jgi:hypothetical protein
MTNLLISYPAIPFDSIDRAQSVTFNERRLADNVITGERYQYATATAGASGTIEFEFDLGVGNTSTVDHVVLINSQKLIDQGTTEINLDTASNGVGGTYTNVWNLDPLIAGVGTHEKDLIVSGLNLTAARTWKFWLSGGASTTRDISKIYFGTALDLEKDPASFNFELISPEGSYLKGEDGNYHSVRLGEKKFQVSLSWQGVSDAKANLFYSKICRYWQKHLFALYTTAEHRILNNHYMIYGRFVSQPIISRTEVLEAGAWVGYNNISAVFVEAKG